MTKKNRKKQKNPNNPKRLHTICSQILDVLQRKTPWRQKKKKKKKFRESRNWERQDDKWQNVGDF